MTVLRRAPRLGSTRYPARTAAGIAYSREGLNQFRLGLTFEVATTVGGVVGGLIAVSIAPSLISGLFSVVMVVVAVQMWRHVDPTGGRRPDEVDVPARSLSGSCFDRALRQGFDTLRVISAWAWGPFWTVGCGRRVLEGPLR